MVIILSVQLVVAVYNWWHSLLYGNEDSEVQLMMISRRVSYIFATSPNIWRACLHLPLFTSTICLKSQKPPQASVTSKSKTDFFFFSSSLGISVTLFWCNTENAHENKETETQPENLKKSCEGEKQRMFKGISNQLWFITKSTVNVDFLPSVFLWPNLSALLSWENWPACF